MNHKLRDIYSAADAANYYILITNYILILLSIAITIIHRQKMKVSIISALLLMFASNSCSTNLKMKSLTRKFVTASLTALLPFASIASASTVLNGEVVIGSGVSVPSGENAALYLTVREDVGVWQSSVRNVKPPPVLSKRIPVTSASFPLKFTISSDADSTPEGVALMRSWTSGKNPLIITARVDEDGVAATRGPNDLIGRSNSDFKTVWEDVNIEVKGRGVAGKFITNKK